jgi:hypothetical protein
MPVVYSAAHPTEAHLCRQFLEDQGIEARVDGELLWQARGELPPNEATNPTVLVSDEKFEQARLLVVEFEANHAADRELDSWSCSQCDEDNPGSFDECWNCGAAMASET